MKHIAVVGGANVDICGASIRPATPRDSNPGVITMFPGGVGRNIAQSLSALGACVRLVCALGRDDRGAFLEKSCRAAGIDLSLALYPQGGVTSAYLCINDHQGDLITAISDMSICESLTPGVMEERLGELNKSDLVVLDANLPRETIEYLAKHVTAPLAADPVSTPKCKNLLPALHRLEAIKPNLPEAQTLTGLKAEEVGIEGVARALHEMGAKRVLLSLGGKGAYYTDGSDMGFLPCCPGPILDTTGCGDAFLAGALMALLEGNETGQAARRALASAAIRAAGKTPSAAAIDNVLKDGGVLL